MAVEPEEIADEEVISQRISVGRADINAPRPKDQNKLSALRGRISPGEAQLIVTRGKHPLTHEDGVRRTTAGELRESGFTVEHTPNNFNPNHVTITYFGEWDHIAEELFVSCFTEREWHREEAP
ncbi:hypothetical protein [Aeromicrobium sp. Root344]|uniref:hypothetical protein n=1 Tax=Aeromicrobium sp. Root344 TaxID=1736521 RepID=UPI0012FCFF83|nr:hypothetical protein [Aeromicrobium sp. Root344]